MCNLNIVEKIEILPVSMVDKNGLQLVTIEYYVKKVMHMYIRVYDEKDNLLFEQLPVSFDSGFGCTTVKIPKIENNIMSKWVISDLTGKECCVKNVLLTKPIEREFYIMISSHTDIGLHNSQYIQRYNSSKFIENAMQLCDETDSENKNNRYRYTVEGTWFFNNYVMDRGCKATENLVHKYVKDGKIGVCSGFAGNHIQTFGLEEMCRFAYERKRLEDEWGVSSHTMSMIDNNGLPMSMIQPLSDAGYKNVIFSPNQWNVNESSVWRMNRKFRGCTWSSECNGGGSRIDIRYTSELPMVFYWEDLNKNRLLVFGSLQYDNGGEEFGLLHNSNSFEKSNLPLMEQRFAEKLPLIDQKYPYNIWFLTCYGDDEKPNLGLLKSIKEWNANWEWPKLRTLGNPDEPFDILREKHNDAIPVVTGDITGGWYQHPISAADCLARKFEADRLLPTAEKWSTIASMLDSKYKYPAYLFDRAWYNLLCNDEHSYGTSGYQGRRVCETWMQHEDWIEKSYNIASSEIEKSLRTIVDKINIPKESLIVFNPTLHSRLEYVKDNEKGILTKIPPFGYKRISKSDLMTINEKIDIAKAPPVIENQYYLIKFDENGSIASIFDKDIKKEIVDTNNNYKVNDILYTNDNHRSFSKTISAKFEVKQSDYFITVKIISKHEIIKAEIITTVTIPNFEKRIDFCNDMFCANDMAEMPIKNNYLYFAFPFDIENAKRYCHLNGCVAEYAKDVTGHSTDVYMAANEWCCAENNDHGVALMLLDNQLIEFDRIHTDKTDYLNTGDGSQMFVYAANAWLKARTVRSRHINYKFRFSVTSYSGDYKKANIPLKAELYANPVNVIGSDIHSGEYFDDEKSFLITKYPDRLLTLKPAEDEKGLIARFYHIDDFEEPTIISLLDKQTSVISNTVDERSKELVDKVGFITYRLNVDGLDLKIQNKEEIIKRDNKPSPIGSVYTGLITTPCAYHSENRGEIYLLWGYNNDVDFSHYRLFRSEVPGFIPNDETFIANVEPEEYVVGRYVDSGLKDETAYYYRVCAVNKAGNNGTMSDEFIGYTREVL